MDRDDSAIAALKDSNWPPESSQLMVGHCHESMAAAAEFPA
jgi:hypothetical protein